MNNSNKCTEWNGYILRSLFNAGTNSLGEREEILNSMDIYPSPSNSTGTGVYLTLQAGCDEILNLDEPSASKVASIFAHGTLMGARSHHGVVFSQWFRGFARGLDNVMKIDQCSLANALFEAAQTTYRGMIRPLEGDLWWVAEEVAEEAKRLIAYNTDLCIVLQKATEQAKVSVRHTTQVIPVLKEADLVHTDGLALFFFMNGMCHYLGEEYSVDDFEIDTNE